MSSPQKANGSRGRARMRSRPDHDGPARDTFAVRPDKVAVAVPPAHDLFGLAVVGFDEAEFVARAAARIRSREAARVLKHEVERDLRVDAERELEADRPLSEWSR